MKKIIQLLTNFRSHLLHANQIITSCQQWGMRSAKILFLSKLFQQKYPPYTTWITCYDQLSKNDRKKMKNDITSFVYQPLISVIMPTYNTPIKYLRKAIDSVIQQLYPHWELCITDDASTNPEVREVLEEYAKKNVKIKIIFNKKNCQIAEASNAALTLATGEFIALLDHDDVLAEHALYWIAKKLNDFPSADLLYSDEDKIDENEQRFNHTFKTDWNPLLLMSVNYINHLSVYRAAIVKKIGGFRKGFEGSQDHDLLLRFIEQIETKNIHHIPRILYHWRVLEGSTSGQENAKPYASDSTKKAIQSYFERNHINAELTSNPLKPMWPRALFKLPKSLPRITIIASTCIAIDLLKNFVNEILDPNKTDYDNLELIIVDNHSQDNAIIKFLKEIAKDSRVKILYFSGPLDWASINNFASSKVNTDFLLLIKNGVKPLQSDWLKEMVSYMVALPNIAAVGAKLYDTNKKIHSTGYILNPIFGGMQMHAGCESDFLGYSGVLCQARNISAITADCMLIRKSAFEKIGGIDENAPTPFNDIEFCIRLIKAGHQIVWTPYAQLYYYESTTRTQNLDLNLKDIRRFKKATTYLKQKHPNFMLSDPFYNSNLSLHSRHYQLAFPPRNFNSNAKSRSAYD